MTNQQLHPGLFFGELTHATFGSQLAPSSKVSSPASLLAFGVGINTCLHSASKKVFLFLSVLQEREEEKRHNWVSGEMLTKYPYFVRLYSCW